MNISADIEAETLAENGMDIGEEVPYAEPLAPEEIRWFYKDGVDKRWVEFCGYDSLRIEEAWRKKMEKERNANETNDDCERVVVKGGMYDVKLDDMKCVSIFWAGEEWEIMRATWYYEASWIPLELEHSRVIEESHLKLFEKRKGSTAGSTPEEASPSHSYRVLHTERFSEFHVDWHAINDVALYSEYTTSKLMRSVTSRLGFSKTSGYQLRRGYKVNASISDKPNDIDHLVFVVHGIGQKRDTQKIIRNTALKMSNLQNPHVVAIALGATIGVISAASLFIYQKVIEHNERTTMLNNLESVNRRVSELQVELETLRTQQNQLRAKKSKNVTRRRVASSASLYSAAGTDNEIDAVSVTETDMDDEFYDCSDDEITTVDFEINGTAGVTMELTRQLDRLDCNMESTELQEEVLCDLRALAIFHENNIDVAWRLAKACFKNASALSDTSKQDPLILEGMKICENFLEEEHGELHRWYALLAGLRSEYLPTKERLKAGKIFEKHLKLALHLTPDDPVLNHLLGRFQYTVASLTWIEKKICATLFGEVPTSTYEEAIESLEKAEKLSKSPDIENKYFLGQAYVQVKAYEKGVIVLNQILDLNPKTVKQREMQKESHGLVAKYLAHW
ncbi:regulator of microtubule dynamics protein 2-like isoform X2 [Diachasmimorpha longicaudata]|uniref:regulator of microtubule dynamics protein 2-like isoform X2 n=1 Tax=Diachasmimorpha longicaudata TaxID=58733 RepID=UPI0030B8B386